MRVLDIPFEDDLATYFAVLYAQSGSFYATSVAAKSGALGGRCVLVQTEGIAWGRAEWSNDGLAPGQVREIRCWFRPVTWPGQVKYAFRHQTQENLDLFRLQSSYNEPQWWLQSYDDSGGAVTQSFNLATNVWHELILRQKRASAAGVADGAYSLHSGSTKLAERINVANFTRARGDQTHRLTLGMITTANVGACLDYDDLLVTVPDRQGIWCPVIGSSVIRGGRHV